MKLFKLFNCISLFLILFLLIPCEIYAGDIKIKGFFWFQKAMKGREQPILSTIENIENYAVEGANFKLTIKYKMSAEIEYEWTKSLGTVPANSSTVIEADTPWIPQQKGTYTFLYELTSQNDINPANDISSFDVEVINPYYWITFGFSQYNFINPFQQENSNTGSADFTVVASGSPLYANFMIAPDDTIAHAEWLVQNVILHSVADTDRISEWLDLEKIGIQNGMDLKYLWYDFKITPNPIKNPFTPTGLIFGKVGDVNYNVGGDAPLEWEFPKINLIPEVDWNDGDNLRTWHYRGCEVANIDLDSSMYNPRDIPGESGDWNCCAPASAVNSLQWLEDKDPNIPKTNKTLREKLKIFNELSKRANESGLNTTNTIKGKLAYIDSLRLPIHVKWQGVPYDTTIASPNSKFKHLAESKNDSVGAYVDFEWLATEMKNGEDVELKFGWYDSTGTRHGGHWVVVSGIIDVNFNGIFVKDDQDQSKLGGTRQTFVNWVTNDEGRPRLVGFKAVNNYCWVESAVSESYDSTITFPFEIPEKIKNIKIEKLIPADSFFDVFYKINFEEKRLFSFDIIPQMGNKFLNVKVKNKDSGEESWVVKNMFLPNVEVVEKISTWFNWATSGNLKSGSDEVIEFVYDVTDEAKITDDFNPDYWQETNIGEMPISKSLNIDDTDISEGMQNAILRPLGEDLNDLLALVFRGNDMPNIDLDSSLYNPEKVNEYAGDKNACAPASAANSLEWLESNYPEINSKLTLRKKLNELSKMMQRENNNGVTRTNFIKAKLDFIDKYKLPIHVKFQSWKLGIDSVPSPNNLYGHFAENKTNSILPRLEWEWLKQEMENGEDVEMELGYYNSNGIREGGHWITVSGIVDLKTIKGIYFSDDLNQLGEFGTKQQYVTCDTAWTYPYIRELSSETVTCYIESVVSESYDDNISFIPLNIEDLSKNDKLNLKVYENPSSRLKPITISFDVIEPGEVNLFIYEISGKLIYSEKRDFANTGNKTIHWNGKGNKGVLMGNGTYIVKIKTHELESTTKIIRMD